MDDKLLTAYRAKCSHGWPTGPNDGYFFEHLRHHLVSVGHSTEAFQLLQDLDWLGAKTRAGLVFDLVRDVQEAEQDLTEADRAAFLPWSHFLRGNASFLSEHPASFFQQAYNEPIQSLVSQSAQHLWALANGTREQSTSVSPSLVPTTFLEWLNRPIEWQQPACVMTLQGHTHYVTCVALSEDGSTLVSGSFDESVKRSVEKQRLLQTSRCISSFDESVERSVEKTVKVWDARTGACRATYPDASPKARAAWQSVRVQNDAARCDIVAGSLRIPDPDVATSLVVFGPFRNAVGPLVDDKILAFNGKGEAFWFQIRRRKGS